MAQTSFGNNTTHDTIADQISNVTDSVESTVRDATGEVQKVAGNIRQAVDTSVRDQPMATLLMTAAIGFVLGALWKS